MKTEIASDEKGNINNGCMGDQVREDDAGGGAEARGGGGEEQQTHGGNDREEHGETDGDEVVEDRCRVPAVTDDTDLISTTDCNDISSFRSLIRIVLRAIYE